MQNRTHGAALGAGAHPDRPRRGAVATALRVAARAAAPLLVLAALHLGGCGTCRAVDEAWTTRLRAEQAAVGAGVDADTGLEDHLALYLGADALTLLVGALPAETLFDVATAQITFGRPAIGRRDDGGDGRAAFVTAEVAPRLAGAALPGDAGARNIEVFVDSVVSIDYDALDRSRVTVTSVAHATLVVPLRLDAVDGAVALRLELGEATVRDVAVERPGVPPAFDDVDADAVAALVDRTLAEGLRATSPSAVIARWDAAALPTGPLRYTASSLEIDAARIRIGVVTQLRPRGAGPARALPGDPPSAAAPTDADPAAGSDDAPAEQPVGDDAAYEVHPDLWRAALAQGYAVGRLQRVFDAQGEPAPDADRVVAVDAAQFSNGRPTLTFSSYCLAGGACSLRDATIAWTEPGAAGAWSLGAAEAAQLPHAARVASDAAATLRALLTPPTLRLYDDRTLVFNEPTIGVDGGRLVVRAVPRTIDTRPGATP